ncbi:uncharacterized protein LOC118426600 [Branchiostoma floridae]|nr:uncharacterized protein LOC118426600 [Branchiostoma floridae]
MEEGEVDAAERRSEIFLSVDEERGHVERSVLSESMAEFCEGLRTHWAVKSSTETTPTPGATVEEEEAEANAEMEEEVLSGTNGTIAVQQRKKRVVGTRVCYWATRNICSRTCGRVCGKRRRRALTDGEPDQEVKKRAKRGWIRRVVRRVVSAVCRAVCTWGCRALRVKVCTWVG